MNRLPEGLEELTVDLLIDGQDGYVVPWAMWVDLDRRMWIHPKYGVDKEPGGTCHMRIQREGDVIVVFQKTIGDHRYTPSAFPGFVSPADTQYLPVVLR